MSLTLGYQLGWTSWMETMRSAYQWQPRGFHAGSVVLVPLEGDCWGRARTEEVTARKARTVFERSCIVDSP